MAELHSKSGECMLTRNCLFSLVISQLFCFSISAQTNLFDAIRSGSSDEVNKALTNGATANDSLTGYSALMFATLDGTVEQMSILIRHGANVNYQNADSISALWLALPDMDKISLLLNHGADINHKIDGYGILTKLAMIPGTINVFQFMIARGADPLHSGPDNLLLYNAAATGDTTLLGFLLRLGLKVNDTTSFGEVPVNGALQFRSPAALKMLVEHGANVNFQNLHELSFPAAIGLTPLMNAALFNDKESFLILLDHGADPNMRNKNGVTALILLQQSDTDDPEMTLALIKHGAKPEYKEPDGSDALFFAKQKGNTPTVALLQKYLQK
jgi:ankyrin repeat protein